MKINTDELAIGDEIMVRTSYYRDDLRIINPDSHYTGSGAKYFVLKVIAIKKAKVTFE